MIRYEERFITLPSNGGGSEFTDNTNAKFRVRLAAPLVLNGQGWEVALSSISFPANPLHKTTTERVLQTFPATRTLAVKRVFTDWKDKDGIVRRKWIYVHVETGEVCDGAFPVNDGITFMRAIVNTLDTKTEKERAKEPSQLPGDQGGYKRPYTNPIWVNHGTKLNQVNTFDLNNNLIIEGTDAHITVGGTTDYPFTAFHLDLAKAWGIVTKDGALYGPALRYSQLNQNVVPSTTPIADTSFTWLDGVAIDLSNRVRMARLQAPVTWEIMNLNTGWFEATFTPETKTMRVFSNVGESRLVGNQRVDLLREVRMDEDKEGQQYYEPRHLEYIPVRRQAFEVLDIHIDDLNGGTINFGTGVTSVTLHFRRPIN